MPLPITKSQIEKLGLRLVGAVGADALEARFAAEAKHNGDANIEIVALAAASEDDLRRTHGRYFLGLSELVARMS